MRRALLGLTFTQALACGTALYHHVVQVSALGPSPSQVGVFNRQEGYTYEWARRALGASDSRSPYSATLTTTAATTLSSTNTARPLTVAIAIPDITDSGYFLLTIDTPQEQESRQAEFCRYGEYFPSPQATRIPLQVSAKASKGEWHVNLVVDVASAKQMMGQQQ